MVTATASLDGSRTISLIGQKMPESGQQPGPETTTDRVRLAQAVLQNAGQEGLDGILGGGSVQAPALGVATERLPGDRAEPGKSRPAAGRVSAQSADLTPTRVGKSGHVYDHTWSAM